MLFRSQCPCIMPRAKLTQDCLKCFSNVCVRPDAAPNKSPTRRDRRGESIQKIPLLPIVLAVRTDRKRQSRYTHWQQDLARSRGEKVCEVRRAYRRFKPHIAPERICLCHALNHTSELFSSDSHRRNSRDSDQLVCKILQVKPTTASFSIPRCCGQGKLSNFPPAL